MTYKSVRTRRSIFRTTQESRLTQATSGESINCSALFILSPYVVINISFYFDSILFNLLMKAQYFTHTFINRIPLYFTLIKYVLYNKSNRFNYRKHPYRHATRIFSAIGVSRTRRVVYKHGRFNFNKHRQLLSSDIHGNS